MPRNRAGTARSDKLDEIIDAARVRLLDGGYGGLSIADIARELGLSQNAIYWYFATKDHVLVAAVERILHDVLDRKPRGGTTVDRVLWFSERLHEFQDLRLTVRQRARESDVVAIFERDVVALFRTMLVNSLRGSVDKARLDDTADALMALCEGVLLRDVSSRDRKRILRFGVERLLGRDAGSDR